MFTTWDKAIVAIIMGALSIANLAFGWDFGADEETVSGIIAFLTPILVYLVPNRKPEASIRTLTGGGHPGY